MKKLGTMMLLALVASVSPVMAQNFLANPGFEISTANNFPDNWAGFDQAGAGFQGGWSTAFAHGGTHSVRFDNRTAEGTFEGIVANNASWIANPANPTAHEFIAVTPGESLSFGGFALNNAADPMSGTSFAQFQLEFYDSSFSASSTFSGWGHSAKLDGNSLSTSTWNQFTTGNVLAPTGAAYAKFTIVNNPAAGANTGSFFVDDVAAIPEPSSMALAIGGFALMGLTLRRKK